MKRMKTVLLPLAILGFALALCGPAMADKEDPKDLAAVSTAKTTLLQAVNAVEKQGGQPVKALLRWEKGAPVYVVVSLNQEKKLKTVINSDTGAVVSSKDDTELGWFGGKEKDKKYAGLDQAKLTLAQAIAKAEGLNGGKTFEAGFESKNKKKRFEISLAKGNVVYEVVINAATGDVVKLVQGKEKDHDD
ncbi:hypothetical protein JCM15519_21750 [Fundidesulfovibrio butyratiphilus]